MRPFRTHMSFAMAALALLVISYASFGQSAHDLMIDKVVLIPQFPQVGEKANIVVSVVNLGDYKEINVPLRVFAYGFHDTLHHLIPEISSQSSILIDFEWKLEKPSKKGRIFINAFIEPVIDEIHIENNGLDYGNTTDRDFIADAPWRVEGNEIPFLFLIADAGEYFGIFNTRLDSICIFDENENGSRVKTCDFGGELLGDDPSEETFWAYESSISVNSFTTLDGEIYAKVKFFINGPNPEKYLKIKAQSIPFPSFENWYYGDTHFHSLYSRAGDHQGWYDVEFGAPLFAIHDALLEIGLDWVTITDHSCYLDEEPFTWEYEIEGEESDTLYAGSSRWSDLTDEISDFNYTYPNFKFILGEEVTVEGNTPLNPLNPDGKTLHYLMYDDDYIAAGNTGSNLVYPEFPASITLRDALDSTQINDGFGYAAHPVNLISPVINGTKWADEDYDIAEAYGCFRGLELWNGRKTADSAPNEYSNNPFPFWELSQNQWTPSETYSELEEGMAVWDSLLGVGLLYNAVPGESRPRQFYIEGGSDAHGDFNYVTSIVFISTLNAKDNAAGKVRTLAYCPNGLSVENIKAALQGGHTIITDGPLVHFGLDIDNDNQLNSPEDLTIGESGIIQSDVVTDVNIIMNWQSTSEFGSLDSVCLYAGTPGSFSDPDRIVRLTPGSLSGNSNLNLSDYLTPIENHYIYLRLAGYSSVTTDEQYRCYTNPIWLKVVETLPQIDAALVIDRSGSMAGAYIESAKTAARAFVGFMQIGDNFAVVSFNTSATVNFPLTSITSQATITAAQNAINSISATGGTSIGAGIQSGQGQLNFGNTEIHQGMILLSDGYENAAPYVASVLPTIPTNTDIYTIALGPNSDQDLLNYIADQTGGVYYFAPDPADLLSLYNLIKGGVTGEQTVATSSGTITQGETQIINVLLDLLFTSATFYLTFEGSDVDFELVDPNGVTIDSLSAVSDPNISFSEGPTYDFYNINSPVNGLWELHVIGVDVPTPELFTTTVQGVSNLEMETFLDKGEYDVGQPVLISCALSEFEIPIQGATVSTEILIPSGRFSLDQSHHDFIEGIEEIDLSGSGGSTLYENNEREFSYFRDTSEVLTLYDDGIHGDSLADDGIYANYFTNTATEGSYTFTVSASGTAPIGGQFTRESTFSTFVALTPRPPAPQLVYPPNGADSISVAPTLGWFSSSGAISYRIQVCTNSNFDTLAFDSSGVTDTLMVISELAPTTQYFWRVNAMNLSGTSDWSPVWSFTTEVGRSLTIPGLQASKGSEVYVPIIVSNFSGIAGVELHIRYSNQVLAYGTVTSQYLIDATINESNSQVHVIWDDYSNPVSLSNGDTLLTLEFEAISLIDTISELNFQNCELADSLGNPLATEYNNGLFTSIRTSLITLSITNTSGITGEEVNIPIVANNFKSVAGVELHIQFNDQVLEYDSTITILFNPTVNENNGQINIIWDDYANPMTLGSEDTLALLVFTVIGAARSTSSLSFINSELADEFGNSLPSRFNNGAFYSAVNVAIPLVTIQMIGQSIILNWSNCPGAFEYSIYRSDFPNFQPDSTNELDRTVSLTYLDPNALLTENHFYVVTANFVLASDIGVKINEIYYDHADSDSGHEFIELYNDGDQVVYLADWMIQWAGSNFGFGTYILPGVFILPHSYYLIGGEHVETNFGVIPNLIYDFDFRNGGAVADGVRICLGASYFDTILYGIWNLNSLRGDDNDPGMEICPDVLPGQSLERSSPGYDTDQASDWIILDTPTPTRSGIDVLDAPDASGDDLQKDYSE